MSTIHLDQFRQRDTVARGTRLSTFLLAAALSVVAAASLVLLAPIAWSAVKAALQAPYPTLAQCAMVPTDSDRLACFDQLGKQALRPPAKGAGAPPR